MKYGICVALMVALSASAALAENGVPSQSKLNSLGLSSMQVASDAAGEEIRGEGFGYIGISFIITTSTTSTTTPPVTTTTSQVPFNLAFTFGTEPQTQANLFRQGYGGTVVFDQDTDGSINPATFTNTPVEVSTTVTNSAGLTTVNTFKFSGGLFANGN